MNLRQPAHLGKPSSESVFRPSVRLVKKESQLFVISKTLPYATGYFLFFNIFFLAPSSPFNLNLSCNFSLHRLYGESAN